MPTFSKEKKKWVAKRKRGDYKYHLGYFRTYLEALAVEEDFDRHWPARSRYIV